ncbi:MAG: DUF3127 domain-containing protein [Bacteroidales bacterium]|nr:DUF3127 domain-containing protein [Bacteroidales bacterium]
MEIKAKLIQILPLQTGQGKNGTWKKQDIIVETLDNQYPKKICLAIWQEKLMTEQILKIGNLLNLYFDIESREFNNRWYTDLKVWRIDVVDANATSQIAPDIIEGIESENDDIDGDLPF